MDTIESLQAKILALPDTDRARLLDDLIASFDTTEDVAISEAWLNEVKDRRQAYLAGEMNTVSAEELKKQIGLPR